jgi:hypothetical protein
MTPFGLSGNEGQGDGEFGKMAPNLGSQAPTWATPNVPNGGRAVDAPTVEAKGQTPDGKRQVGLESQSKHWATPRAEHDSGGHRGNEDTLHSQVKTWPTPKAAKARAGATTYARGNPSLAKSCETWPTPAARDAKGANDAKHLDQLPNFVAHCWTGHPMEFFRRLHRALQTTVPGLKCSNSDDGICCQLSRLNWRLNPRFVFWLMGWLTGAERTGCGWPETGS